jgi:hypothetical protein
MRATVVFALVLSTCGGVSKILTLTALTFVTGSFVCMILKERRVLAAVA